MSGQAGGPRSAVLFLAILWLSVWCLPDPSSSWADISSGRAWLAAQSQPDGRYATVSDLATPVQASAEVLRAFQALGDTTSPGLFAARAYLTAEPFHSTEYLARIIRMQADTGAPVSDLVTALLTHQNADGGFGDLPGYASTALDTAFALETLAAAGDHSAATAGAAVSFLRRQQDASGGWADGSNAPTVYVAALAMHALWLHRQAFDMGEVLDQAQAFLLAQRTGSAWGAPFETALAVLAILPRHRDTALLTDSLTALQAAQATDGSWANDVYTTALALRALALAATPVPNPDLSTLQGRVVDGDSGIALSGVTVELTGAATRTHVTDTTGTFAFLGLVTGNYTLALRLADYGTVTTMTALSSGGQADLGEVRLLKSLTNPTTGTVHGVVTSVGTGAPLAGVTLTVNGLTTFTASAGTYQFSTVQPGPVTVTASLPGYLSAFGSGELLAGSVLVFSPSLMPDAETPVEAALFGVVTAAATDLPLSGVTVQVTGSTMASAQTDSSRLGSNSPSRCRTNSAKPSTVVRGSSWRVRTISVTGGWIRPWASRSTARPPTWSGWS